MLRRSIARLLQRERCTGDDDLVFAGEGGSYLDVSAAPGLQTVPHGAAVEQDADELPLQTVRFNGTGWNNATA